MSGQYHVQMNEDEVGEFSRTDTIYPHMMEKGWSWPFILGLLEIFTGMIVILLGVSEVFIVPLMESVDGQDLVWFNRKTVYGLGIVAGFLLILAGSTFLRVTFTRRNSTIHRFFYLIITCLLFYVTFVIVLLVSYAHGWTSFDNYPEGSSIPKINLALSVFSVLGLNFVGVSFAMYFNVVCLGSYPLYVPWLRFIKGLCRCCIQTSRRHDFDSNLSEDFNTRCNPI